LSSSRKAARQGYATALVHVINLFKTVTYEKVTALSDLHLACKGSFKMQEERDAYFGQVFVQLVVIRSFLFSDGVVQPQILENIVNNLLRLMKKKVYLIEICAASLADIIKKLDYDNFSKILPLLEPMILNGWDKCQPHHLFLAITVQQKFKEELPKKYFKSSWGVMKLCSEDKFSELKNVLMDTTTVSHPQVHSLWRLVLDDMLRKL
jgi:hypothetical protein